MGLTVPSGQGKPHWTTASQLPELPPAPPPPSPALPPLVPALPPIPAAPPAPPAPGSGTGLTSWHWALTHVSPFRIGAQSRSLSQAATHTGAVSVQPFAASCAHSETSASGQADASVQR